MTLRQPQKLIARALAVLILSMAVPADTPQSERSFSDYWGPQFSAQPGVSASPRFSLQVDGPDAPAPGPATSTLIRWNSISINASGLDHTPVAPGENRVFGVREETTLDKPWFARSLTLRPVG